MLGRGDVYTEEKDGLNDLGWEFEHRGEAVVEILESCSIAVYALNLLIRPLSGSRAAIGRCEDVVH